MMATLSLHKTFTYPRTQPENNSQISQLMCLPLRDYTLESERLDSFVNWPNREVSKETLAKAGFYYIGVRDIVRCAFCGTEGFKWNKNDNPMEDHCKWKPTCSFVRRIQRTSESSNSDGQADLGHDTCGSRIEIFPKSVADDELLEKLGANKTKGPKHKEFALLDNRLRSFANWPKSLRQKPSELAEAGFFYRGTGDQTLCFYCGGGLNDWEESDEPWEQHALWFPKCNFVLMKKGQEYVDRVKNKAPALEMPSASSSNSQAKELVKSEASVESSSRRSSTVTSTTESSDTNGSGRNSEDSRLCKICYKNEMGVLFLPCGHIVACVDCASALSNCAICRKKVEATVRAFLS